MSTNDPIEGFPIFDGLGMLGADAGLESKTKPQNRTKRILGAITTYLTVLGEQFHENNVTVAPSGEIVFLPNITLPEDQP